jgi:hypothetical protein
MLRVELLDEDGRPKKMQATRLVVYDEDTGNPISLAVEYHPGVYYTSQIGDSDFNALLESLGINKTMLFDVIDTPGND